MANAARLLRVYTDESAYVGDRKVFEYVTALARERRLAGATVLEALMGFGHSAQLHRKHVFESDRALVIEIVDGEDKLRAFAAELGRRGYAPATLSYGNLNASAVPTIAARAYLVTRNFRGALKKAELSKLKAYIVANLEEFVEGRGYSPKWKEVKPDAATVWAKYETLP